MRHFLKLSATKDTSVFAFACALVFAFFTITAYPDQLSAKAIESASDWRDSKANFRATHEFSDQSIASESLENSNSNVAFASNGKDRYLILADNHADSSSSNLAEISITAENSQLTEGENVEFRILANSIANEHIIINVHIWQHGDFILWPVPTEVELPAGKDQALVSIASDDDRQDEKNGMITAKLTDGEGYILSSRTTAAVEIFDNDDESTADSADKTEISVAGAVIANILAGISKPTITIFAVEDSVVKGNEAEFKIFAHPAPKQDVSIELLVRRFGNSPTEKVRSVILKANSGSLTVPVKTERDDTPQITVSILEAENFAIGTASSASVTINE